MEINIEKEAADIAITWCKTPCDYYEAQAAIVHLCKRIIAVANNQGEKGGLQKAIQVARDRLERSRNHGPNIELNQDKPGYDHYRAGSIVASQVIMNTIRALLPDDGSLNEQEPQ